MNDASVLDVLNLIHPKLESQLLLAKQVAITITISIIIIITIKIVITTMIMIIIRYHDHYHANPHQVALIEPLKDLAAHEPDTTFLSPESLIIFFLSFDHQLII